MTIYSSFDRYRFILKILRMENPDKKDTHKNAKIKWGRDNSPPPLLPPMFGYIFKNTKIKEENTSTRSAYIFNFDITHRERILIGKLGFILNA